MFTNMVTPKFNIPRDDDDLTFPRAAMLKKAYFPLGSKMDRCLVEEFISYFVDVNGPFSAGAAVQ